MSNIRIVAQFHNGNEIRTVDQIAPHALDILPAIDSALPAKAIAKLLGRPNDVHGAKRVESGWWTICQVWTWDKRDAKTILSDAREHDSQTYLSQLENTYGVYLDAAYGFKCSYGCKCGRFPLDTNYHQDLAVDR